MYISRPFELDMIGDSEPFGPDEFRLMLTDTQYAQLLLVRSRLNEWKDAVVGATLFAIVFILDDVYGQLLILQDGQWLPAEQTGEAELPTALSLYVTRSKLTVELDGFGSRGEALLDIDRDFEYVPSEP